MIKTSTALTFEDYLTYDDGTDNRYELEDGDLILMNPPSFNHALISRFLINIFEAEIKRLSLSWLTFSNVGIRTSITRSRIPDLVLLHQDQIPDQKLSAVLTSPPLLIVEIVSPESCTRDYRYKRSEYAATGIPEYWIVDPEEQKVTVLKLVEGFYEEEGYQSNEKLQSQVFSELSLTANQILQP
jgi:Uma2 family endonuclease